MKENKILKQINKMKPFMKKTVEVMKKGALKIWNMLKRNRRSALVFLPIFLILYYVVGSAVSEKIDKNTNFEIKNVDKGYAYVQASADLIRREIDEHLFTPNLPFVFPAWALDNMPAFQKGIIGQLQSVAHTSALNVNSEALQKADELLSYPSEVWLFSQTKDFRIEPSSVAQYRKARRYLLKFNEHAKRDDAMFEKILAALYEDLANIQTLLEKQIATQKSGNADDVFYFSQGRLYALYVVMKAIQKDSGTDLSSVSEPMEQALNLNPTYVKNGALAGFSSPNHLLELAYFTLKARYALSELLRKAENAD